jgi:hypothetical protein
LLACFWPRTGAATVAFFNKENSVRFFVCPLFLSLKLPSSSSSLLFIWLGVHLYRKSLHVLFKEILQ